MASSNVGSFYNVKSVLNSSKVARGLIRRTPLSDQFLYISTLKYLIPNKYRGKCFNSEVRQLNFFNFNVFTVLHILKSYYSNNLETFDYYDEIWILLIL